MEQVQQKPVIGISIALVLGGAGLIVGLLSINEAAINGQMIGIGAMPALLMSLANIAANAVIMVGAIMLIMDRLAGGRAIRLTSFIMLLITAFSTLYAYYAITAGPVAGTLSESAMTGSVIGAGIGGAVQWLVLMLLLRPES